MSQPRARLVHQQALAAEDAARELAAGVARRQVVVDELEAERGRCKRRFALLAVEIREHVTARTPATCAAQIRALVRTALYDLARVPKRKRQGCQVPPDA